MRISTFFAASALVLMMTGSAAAQDRTCKSANPADNEVFLYVDINFGGHCVSLQKFGTNIPDTSKLGVPNDSISSIKVGNGVRALVCKDFDFKGDCQSHLQNWKDLTNTVVGNDQISSVKVLQKRDSAQLHFVNRLNTPVKIYEKVGGVDSYLGTVDPRAGAVIGSDVMTSVIAKVDEKAINGGFQIKNPGKTNATIAQNAKGVGELKLD